MAKQTTRAEVPSSVDIVQETPDSRCRNCETQTESGWLAAVHEMVEVAEAAFQFHILIQESSGFDAVNSISFDLSKIGCAWPVEAGVRIDLRRLRGQSRRENAECQRDQSKPYYKLRCHSLPP